jgi:hypothetical protein
MNDSFDINSPSPNTQHTAKFGFSGEVRFGPPYYVLSVDDYSFGQRTFGSAHLWSQSSNLLAAQEWLTLDYSEGPITALVIIDVNRGREATVARSAKRFLVPEAFDDSIIRYREENAGLGLAKHFDMDITKIKGWKALRPKRS